MSWDTKSLTVTDLTPHSQYRFIVYARTEANGLDFRSSNRALFGITEVHVDGMSYCSYKM